MTTLFSDTNPAAEQVLVELLRQAPVWRKMEMLAELNAAAHEVALAGLRRRYPLASDAELRRRLADLLLGEALAAQVYGELPHAA
jgi:hypothetical protein